MEAIVASEVFRNAVLEGTLAAVLCSAVGYFMVLRALTFAGEALTDIGFAGATGGVLFGFGPLWGMLGLGFLAVLTLGGLSEKIRGRDVEIGMTLSFALGLGVLFLSLFGPASGSHSGGVNLLFGSLVSVTPEVIGGSLIVAVLVLAVLAVIFRPLLFASIDASTARARGVPTRLLGLVFLGLLAATTAVSVQALGVLLSSALLVAPAGAAHNFRRGPGTTLVLGLIFALGITWTGLALAFFGPWEKAPASFYICVLAAGVYGVSLLADRWRSRLPQQQSPHHHHDHHEAETLGHKRED